MALRELSQFLRGFLTRCVPNPHPRINVVLVPHSDPLDSSGQTLPSPASLSNLAGSFGGAWNSPHDFPSIQKQVGAKKIDGLAANLAQALGSYAVLCSAVLELEVPRIHSHFVEFLCMVESDGVGVGLLSRQFTSAERRKLSSPRLREPPIGPCGSLCSSATNQRPRLPQDHQVLSKTLIIQRLIVLAKSDETRVRWQLLAGPAVASKSPQQRAAAATTRGTHTHHRVCRCGLGRRVGTAERQDDTCAYTSEQVTNHKA